MSQTTTNTTSVTARADQHDIDLHKASDRVNFGSIKEPIDVPYLLGVQTDSFDWLVGNERWKKRVEEDEANGTNTVPHVSGLDEVFHEISPIENFAQTMSLTFSDPYFEEPRHTVQECKEKDYTYSAPLYVNAEFENGETGEIKSQTVFMGDFPLQTPHGTLHHRRHRASDRLPARAFPGRLLRPSARTAPPTRRSSARRSSRAVAHGSSSRSTSATSVGVRVDRKRKQSAIVFLMAIGMTRSRDPRRVQGLPARARCPREGDHRHRRTRPCVDLYRKIRPADARDAGSRPQRCSTPSTSTRSATTWPRVGRYKINTQARSGDGFQRPQPEPRRHHRHDQVPRDAARTATTTFPGKRDGEDVELRVDVDDIDHFGNRRIRAGGRADPEPAAHRSEPHGARGARAHDHAGRRGHHAAVTDQHPSGECDDQGVLRNLPALAVHGPEQPAGGRDAQAPSLRAGPRRPVARPRLHGGARRAPLALRPHVPDRVP